MTIANNTPRGTGRVLVGDRAPDFTLPNQAGQAISLHDYLGKSSIVLYFYPKDNTGGCTAEACAFRDSYEAFKEAGVEVIGVSSDTAESHEQFSTRYQLPFILLSDVGGAVRRLYGVPKTFGLIDGRVTYVIDRQGIVRQVFSALLNPQRHVTEALATLRSLGEVQ